VSWCLSGEKKKVLPQKAQNLTLRDYIAYNSPSIKHFFQPACYILNKSIEINDFKMV
jgi:hypothetical protein